jgi:hypothetical protein
VNGANHDNFTPLTALDWQVHVYGDATADTEVMCDQRQLALHVFPWGPKTRLAGLRRNAVYLLRPDGYVALANPEGSATAVSSYFDARKLTTNRTRSSGEFTERA